LQDLFYANLLYGISKFPLTSILSPRGEDGGEGLSSRKKEETKWEREK